MARKGENIYKRKDGRWEARLIIGRNEKGKAVYKSVYAHSYKEARQKRQKALQDYGANAYPAQAKAGTFLATSQTWIEGNKNRWKESTLRRYQEKLRIYILPEFGKRALSEISTEEIRAFLTMIQTTGMPGRKPIASSTAGMILSILRQIRLQALQDDCLVRYSPECIRLKRSQKRVAALSEQEEKTLISTLKQDMDETAAGILACLFTGMRIGELCALRCADIDLENRILHIRKTMQRLPDPDGSKKTVVKVDVPKSKCSIRDIPISKGLADTLRPFHKPGAYLLSGDKERFIEPRTMENRFAKILEKCGLGKVNYHVTRHTFATRCIERGMDVKTLSEILGHASVSTTMDRYVHLSMKHKTDGMALLSDLFAV